MKINDRVRIAASAPMAGEGWPEGTVVGFLDTPFGQHVVVQFDGWIKMSLPESELTVVG